jgi:hypothetical protein
MKTILKWASWLVSALAICLMFLGSLGYLLGNISIFSIKWGTYYYFAGNFIFLAILLVLLGMSCDGKCKD